MSHHEGLDSGSQSQSLQNTVSPKKLYIEASSASGKQKAKLHLLETLTSDGESTDDSIRATSNGTKRSRETSAAGNITVKQLNILTKSDKNLNEVPLQIVLTKNRKNKQQPSSKDSNKSLKMDMDRLKFKKLIEAEQDKELVKGRTFEGKDLVKQHVRNILRNVALEDREGSGISLQPPPAVKSMDK